MRPNSSVRKRRVWAAARRATISGRGWPKVFWRPTEMTASCGAASARKSGRGRGAAAVVGDFQQRVGADAGDVRAGAALLALWIMAYSLGASASPSSSAEDWPNCDAEDERVVVHGRRRGWCRAGSGARTCIWISSHGSKAGWSPARR